MALYIGSNKVIDNSQQFIPAQYSTRTSLPTGAASYLAFVQDQAELVVSTSTPVSTAGYENGVTWFKFLTKPMDYKNEVNIQQGTVGGGYISSSIWTTVSHVLHATDTLHEMQQTLGAATRYGCWFSTYLKAYYGQGMDGAAISQQDWATFTVATINSQPATWGGSPQSSQPGPKTQNTFGVTMYGTSSFTLAFSTNTWASGQYNLPVSQTFGAGSFGQNYGYSYTYGTNVCKITWSVGSWAQTSSGNASSIATTYGKSLTTKLDYWYFTGDVNGGSGFNKYTNSSDSWTYIGAEAYASQSEQCGIMGQDWGYYIGGYNASVQNAISQRVHYATNTILLCATANGLRALSSGSPAWGPIP